MSGRSTGEPPRECITTLIVWQTVETARICPFSKEYRIREKHRIPRPVGRRFTSGPSPELARLSKSTQFDWRLADDDIAGSRAHARALSRAGLLTADELSRMEASLDELQRRIDSGAFAPIEDDEDEATALERGLLEIAGDELGGKLRAGRSRNDQIACLIRMWLRRHSRVIAGQLLSLASALIDQSVKAGGTVMPGRTHMQHAQPVLLAHPAHGTRVAAAA